MRNTHSIEYRDLMSWLAEMRKKRGITQLDLAHKVGRPQSFVCKYEQCERRLDAIEFCQIAKLLGAKNKEICQKLGIIGGEKCQG